MPSARRLLAVAGQAGARAAAESECEGAAHFLRAPAVSRCLSARAAWMLLGLGGARAPRPHRRIRRRPSRRRRSFATWPRPIFSSFAC